VKLGENVVAIPEAAPVSTAAAEDVDAAAKTGLIEPHLPRDADRNSVIYVPTGIAQKSPAALLVVCQGVESLDADEAVRLWKTACEERGIILVVPQPENENAWQPSDDEHVMRLLQFAGSRYPIDPRRIAAAGERGGGAMAYHLGFVRRRFFRGVAAFDAAIPKSTDLPASDPVRSLDLWVGSPAEGAMRERIVQDVRKLRELQHAIVERTDVSPSRLNEAIVDEIARFVDGLDRI